jgi:DNA helicase-2/ATP-dependent DNA helicase PcrA
VNRHDDASFDRIINQPPRGIGERTLETLRAVAREQDISLWQAAGACVEQDRLAARAAGAVRRFTELIETMTAALDGPALFEQVEHVIHASGLLDHYSAEKGEKAQSRKENLEELVSAARAFVVQPEEAETLTPLDAFLSHAVLESGETQGESWEDCVQMMTLHSAKGLEFPLVFLCGMEEGLFPHQMSLEEPGRLEEERRLCYVGLTRAQRQLVMCHAETRRLYGREHYAMPSRFIGELPAEVLQEVRPRAMVSRPVYDPSADEAAPMADQESVEGLSVGQRVTHNKFGEGVVLNYEGRGSHARVQVNFEDGGAKWLVLAYANLQVL